MRKHLVALIAALSVLLFAAPTADAAPVAPVCNQTWQVIPPQGGSQEGVITSGSAFNNSGEDYIGVVAIRGGWNLVFWTVLHYSSVATTAWDNTWYEQGALTTKYPPKVLSYYQSGYNAVEIRVLGTDGNTYSKVFFASGPSNWFISGYGESWYRAAAYNSTGMSTSGGYIYTGTYLGAPIYKCYY